MRREGATDSRVDGVVLTGGASSRMGRNKASLRHGGRSFARIAVDLLRDKCRSVYLVGGSADDLIDIDLPHVPDRTAGLGPLGGIITAFHWSDSAKLMILPCDLPMMSGRILTGVFDQASRGGDVTVVSSGGRVQPLVGMYSRIVVPVLESFLETGGRSVLRFLSECAAESMNISYYEADEPGLALKNVNSPSEYMSLPGLVQKEN